MLPRSTHALAALTLVLALAAAPSTARAEKKWYGWQILAADAFSAALILGGSGGQAVSVSFVGIGAAFIDGAIVHFVHGNAGQAVLSLGLRVGGAVLGGYLGDMNETKNLGRIGLVQGAAIGLAVGALIDSIFLAHENDEPDTPRMLSIGGRF
jgi:hypothetical protein